MPGKLPQQEGAESWGWPGDLWGQAAAGNAETGQGKERKVDTLTESGADDKI